MQLKIKLLIFFVFAVIDTTYAQFNAQAAQERRAQRALELKNSRARATSLEKELYKAEQVIRRLERENKRLKEENKRLKEENKRLKEKDEHPKEENERLKRENERLKEEKSNLTRVNNENFSALKLQNETIKLQNETIKSQNETIKSQNEIIKSQNKAIEEKQNKIEQNLKEIGDLKSKAGKLEKELEGARKNVKELEDNSRIVYRNHVEGALKNNNGQLISCSKLSNTHFSVRLEFDNEFPDLEYWDDIRPTQVIGSDTSQSAYIYICEIKTMNGKLIPLSEDDNIMIGNHPKRKLPYDGRNLVDVYAAIKRGTLISRKYIVTIALEFGSAKNTIHFDREIKI